MKTVITSSDRSLVSLAELKQYGSLFRNLARRDFLVRYKQAFAGVLWALIKPLVNILVFGYIASKINSAQNAADNFVYVAAAMVLWQFFANVFNDVSNSIVGNSNLFSKVYFPKVIIPLSATFVCLIDFLVSLLILVVLFIATGQSLHWQLLLAPVFILLTLINGFGIGLYFATINVKYRDIKFVVPVLIQFGMYATPVIFSSAFYLERIPTWLHWLFCLNPLLAAIDGFKYCLFGDPIPYALGYFLLSLFSSFFFLFIGIRYFYRFEKGFADYI